MTDQAAKFGIQAMSRIPLYSMNDEQIEGINTYMDTNMSIEFAIY